VIDGLGGVVVEVDAVEVGIGAERVNEGRGGRTGGANGGLLRGGESVDGHLVDVVDER
jgi:hypothetical protein